jgi:hypothetical protein
MRAVIKLRSVTGAALLAAMSLTLMVGCSRERIDWKSAEAADTQEGYDHFLQLHPDSALATQAHTRLAQIAEDKDWQHASAADTADAYKQFLAQHTSGKWAEEARIRMENFTLDSNASPTASPAADAVAPKTAAENAEQAVPGESATRPASAPPAQAPASAAHAAAAPSASPAATPHASPSKPATVAQAGEAAKSVSSPPHAADKPVLATHTSGPASKPVSTASATTENFGIQLGAFSSQAAALSEWKRLQTTYDSELHGLFAHAVPVQVTSGKLFRLQSPVGDESRARSICSSLTKHAQPCVVVLPP